MREIIVRTQAEMDAVDLSFDGVIKVLGKGIKIKFKYKYRAVLWGNASAELWGNASAVLWGNASAVLWENASAVLWGNAVARIFTAVKSLCAYGFSVVFMPFDLKFKFKKEKTVLVQKFKSLPYLEREGIKKERGFVILFKKVSGDFKTQEGTKNETLWAIGTTVTHPKWEPEKKECGEGKFHACSRPYFCDEFRNESGDRYIAIKIRVVDLYEWKNAEFPHKIAFREGKVLYEVNKQGKEKTC
jgi:hypothetical protein